MKLNVCIQLFLLSMLAGLSSCIFMGPSVKGNGNVVEESRETPPFEKVIVTRGMNVYLSMGQKTGVVVKADENLLDAIETKVEDNTLKVTANKNIRNATSNKVYVTVERITGIKSTAGSNIFTETVIETGDLEISSSAGSNIKAELKSGIIEVNASSGSNIMLEGEAERVNGKASSGANIKAEELTVENCFVHVSSGANIWIKATAVFDGSASSGGNIFYYGNPPTINTETSSGGNVIKK
jgi:hypothetical protein